MVGKEYEEGAIVVLGQVIFFSLAFFFFCCRCVPLIGQISINISTSITPAAAKGNIEGGEEKTFFFALYRLDSSTNNNNIA